MKKRINERTMDRENWLEHRKNIRIYAEDGSIVYEDIDTAERLKGGKMYTEKEYCKHWTELEDKHHSFEYCKSKRKQCGCSAVKEQCNYPELYEKKESRKEVM